MTIKTRDVFAILQFDEDWGAMTDEQPGYTIDLGNIVVSASEVLGKSFRPVFFFSSYALTPRSRKIIQFELPLTCESFEQTVALIVKGIGNEFEPEKPATWFALGKTWKEHLPVFQR